MHVIVCVGMIQHESGPAECLELCADLGFQLPSDSRVEEKPETGACEVGGECSVGAHKIGNLFGRKNRPAFHKSQMKTYAQRGTLLGSLYGVPAELRADHKAGRCEDSLSVCLYDGFIHGQGKAKIISSDYNCIQAEPSVAAIRFDFPSG